MELEKPIETMELKFPCLRIEATDENIRHNVRPKDHSKWQPE